MGRFKTSTPVFFLALTGWLSSATSHAFDVRMDKPGQVVLGDRETLGLQLYFNEVVTAERLRFASNVGGVRDLRLSVDGKQARVQFVLPRAQFPQVAYLAVWQEGDRGVRFLPVVLSARTDVPVTTLPNAKVLVKVGNAEFGPAQADATGRAKIEVVVPPGLKHVRVIAQKGALQRKKSVAVDVPPYNRLTVAFTPGEIIADGTQSSVAHVFYNDTPKRSQAAIRRLTIDMPNSTVTALGVSGATARYRVTPNRRKDAEKTNIRVTTAVGAAQSEATQALSLLPPVPGKATVQSKQESIVADGKSEAELFVQLRDDKGEDLEGARWKVEPGAGTVVATEDLGEGHYRIRIKAPAGLPATRRLAVRGHVLHKSGRGADFEYSWPLRPAPWPVAAQVKIRPSRPLRRDGESVQVRILPLNDAGQMTEQADLRVQTPSGKVQKLVRGEDGWYEAALTLKEGSRWSVPLVILDRGGPLKHQHLLTRRAPRPLLSLGARAGLRADAKLGATVGMDVSVTPGWLNRRLRWLVAATFSPNALKDATGESDGQFRIFSFSVGPTYDWFAAKDWRVYAGPMLRMQYAQFVVDGGIEEAAVSPGVSLASGISWKGLFVEAEGQYFTKDYEDVDGVAGPSARLFFGYRQGLF